MTLSHIISNITNQFIPALHYKYVFRNFKQSDIYRSYNPTVVPTYLQGRPKQTILHCLHRQASSNKFSQSDITQMNPHCGKFEVKSNKGKQTVDFGGESIEPTCSCKDWLTTTYHASTFLLYSGIIHSGAGKSYRLATYSPLICHLTTNQSPVTSIQNSNSEWMMQVLIRKQTPL